MRHRRSNDDMGRAVAALEPVRDLGHQSWDLLGVGRLVERSAVSGGDPNRVPMYRQRPAALVALELARFEVEIKMTRSDHWKPGSSAITLTCSIAQGVAGDGELAFIVSTGSFLAGDDRDSFVRWQAEALNRSRAFDRGGLDEATERSQPQPCRP